MTSETDTKKDSKRRNRLADEKSPYLLQHADNPVDWYPWGEEAFERARREDKPVFLSIGYSTCHWCHVMEHESFEDLEVARLMNEAFVNIKVDREERPDIDGVYMNVCQILTNSGGWPLTIIMTPGKQPFFAATYLPKETRFGRVGMLELIPRVQEAWSSERENLTQSAQRIVNALRKSAVYPESDETKAGAGALEQAVLKRAYDGLSERFDADRGGFGQAPKFPTPHNLLFLLRYWRRTGEEQALSMVQTTLRAMRRGGVFDHVGFGFHRYSTDESWLVPHFEKMLYDQAMLTLAYIEAYQATGEESFAATAREILGYVLRDMTDPKGGFYSAEDADSEGEEGKFYVWTRKEVFQVLSEEDAALVAEVFNLEEGGNFNEEATGHLTGANILHLRRPVAQIAEARGMSEQDLRRRLESAREILFRHRSARIHPLKDDKILADWNGLMIAALSRCARVLGEESYAEAAGRAADFVLRELRHGDGKRLVHRYRGGDAGLPAHVDDYAFMVFGLLELYETTFEAEHLEEALRLAEILIEDFWDDGSGGFYFASADAASDLPVRLKEIYDGAIPSGNSMAMLGLLRLSRLTGDAAWEEKAHRLYSAFFRQVEQMPQVYTHLLSALDFAVGPTAEVVVSARIGGQDTARFLDALRRDYHPNMVVLLRLAGGEGDDDPAICRVAPFTKPLVPHGDGQATAYVCHQGRCELPTTDVETMMKDLSSSR